MSALKVGAIIKARREEMGISQEDLADGICAVPTLSRIENGTQLPTKNHLEALLERLGYSIVMVDSYMDGKALRIHELRYKTQIHYINREYEKAGEYLQQLEPLVTDHKSLDWQFVLYQQMQLRWQAKEISPTEYLEELENALLLSCPRYKSKGLPRLLSYREISIANTIAGVLETLERREEAISILQHIRAYYDRHVIVPEEALRTQPMVFYNLSKLLGLSGRYDECIEICDQGIRIARQTGRCTNLERTLYNRGWALLRRNRETDREQAEMSLRQACYQAFAMERKKEYLHFKKYYEETFGSLEL